MSWIHRSSSFPGAGWSPHIMISAMRTGFLPPMEKSISSISSPCRWTIRLLIWVRYYGGIILQSYEDGSWRLQAIHMTMNLDLVCEYAWHSIVSVSPSQGSGVSTVSTLRAILKHWWISERLSREGKILKAMILEGFNEK